MNSIVLFDMDNTLTLPRKNIEKDMIYALKQVLKDNHIGIVTGSDFDYVQEQLTPLFQEKDVDLNRIQLFPCNGTKYYKWIKDKFELIYKADMMTHLGAQYSFILQSLFAEQIILTCKYELPFTGTFFHYRGSMLNWCPIGRSANEDQRNLWIEFDTRKNIRKNILKSLEETIKKFNLDISITLGGSTSFDIYPNGWDKTYVIKHLDNYKKIIFIGDAVKQGENDHGLYTLLKDGIDTQSYMTTNPIVTTKIIEVLILGNPG